MGNKASKVVLKEEQITNKNEDDLPKRERVALKKLLKNHPHLKEVSNKSPTQMSPREWILKKLGLFYVEPFLTELANWTDNKIPLIGSFDRNKLDLIRSYVIDRSLVPDPNWNMKYMAEVYKAWDKMSPQYPGRKSSQRRTRMKWSAWPAFLMSQQIKKSGIEPYPGINNVQPSAPPIYEENGDDDIEMFLAGLVNNKNGDKQTVDNQKKMIDSSTRIMSIKPGLIFAVAESEDIDEKQYKKDCVNLWFKEAQKAIENIAARHRGNSDVEKEQKEYIKCLIKMEFKRIFRIINNKQEPDVGVANICFMILGIWGECVQKLGKQGKVMTLLSLLILNIRKEMQL